MFSIKKLVVAAAMALAVSASAIVGLSSAGTAHADCSPLLKYCLDESKLRIDDANLQIVKSPYTLELNLIPKAEIIQPSDNQVFYVPNAFDAATITVEGKGNGVKGFYTGFDRNTGTGLWWRAFNGQINYDYAEGAQDTMTLHAGEFGCRYYAIELEVWENFTTMASDIHGIAVCVQ